MPKFEEYTHLPIILIAGPTASGKSALALQIATKQGRHIINADSMQSYEPVPLLTARPSDDEQRIVPHHLYGVLGPQEISSAGAWLRAVTPHLKAALNDQGPRLVVVGGTGLYFHSIINGLADIPKVPETVRNAVALELNTRGESSLRDELKQFDPAAYNRIKSNDHQRLIRALSVYRTTGQPLSQSHQNTMPILTDKDYALIVLQPDREILVTRIAQRLKAMWDQGALDEVSSLIKLGLEANWPIMRVLGLREAIDHIQGRIGRDEALTQSLIRTRQYAKRQSTWFRNQYQHNTPKVQFLTCSP